MKIAVFPGSFDPITNGHVDLIRRAIPLFDRIVVAIGVNVQKKYLYPLDKRVSWLEEIFKDDDSISVGSYEGLTVHYCQKVNAKYLLRGLRNTTDYNYEQGISQANSIVGGVETVFLISNPQYSHISSSIVREIVKGNADASAFVPAVVAATLNMS